MKGRALLAVFAVCLGGCVHRPMLAARARDKALVEKLVEALQGFHGEAGVYARHLRTGQTAYVGADEVFPTASLIKVPIMVALFDSIERGDAGYDAPLVYSSSRAYADGDLLASFMDGSSVTVSRLAHLMVSLSDNSAALWLQDLAGGGAGVNGWLEGHGFAATRVNSRTPGREEARERYGWGQTTPREIAELLAMIRQGRAVSPAADDRMLRSLAGSFWDGEALSQIPPYVHAASKQGGVDRARSEAALVSGPSGGYVFAVLTKDQQDATWEHGNEGFALIRRVSRLLWEHFEGRAFEPPPGAERYWKKQ
ncbi:MAG: serine hydrolase [Elusimicrobia bacterium]|nr:serine hydrolase [Elusimicrobiota bacterium]